MAVSNSIKLDMWTFCLFGRLEIDSQYPWLVSNATKRGDPSNETE